MQFGDEGYTPDAFAFQRRITATNGKALELIDLPAFLSDMAKEDVGLCLSAKGVQASRTATKLCFKKAVQVESACLNSKRAFLKMLRLGREVRQTLSCS